MDKQFENAVHHFQGDATAKRYAIEDGIRDIIQMASGWGVPRENLEHLFHAAEHFGNLRRGIRDTIGTIEGKDVSAIDPGSLWLVRSYVASVVEAKKRLGVRLTDTRKDRDGIGPLNGAGDQILREVPELLIMTEGGSTLISWREKFEIARKYPDDVETAYGPRDYRHQLVYNEHASTLDKLDQKAEPDRTERLQEFCVEVLWRTKTLLRRHVR